MPRAVRPPPTPQAALVVDQEAAAGHTFHRIAIWHDGSFRGEASAATIGGQFPAVNLAGFVPLVRNEAAEIRDGPAKPATAAAHACIRHEERKQTGLVEDACLEAR